MRYISDLLNQKLSGLYSDGEIASLVRLVQEQLTGWDYTHLVLNRNAELPLSVHEQAQAIALRLAKSEPVQYVLGETEFCGLPFFVDKNVLIPRPETEELVYSILSSAFPPTENVRLLDIGTGSGCIAVTLKKNCPQWHVSAMDVSCEALDMARRNAQRNEVEITFLQQDILVATHTDLSAIYDVIVSNPPYICQHEQVCMHSNVLKYEPHLALFVPDTDPLLFYRAIATYAQAHLAEGGKLYLEINRAYGQETMQLLAQHNFTDIELMRDISDNDRMVRATKK